LTGYDINNAKGKTTTPTTCCYITSRTSTTTTTTKYSYAHLVNIQWDSF
jgi:hypothetical protein